MSRKRSEAARATDEEWRPPLEFLRDRAALVRRFVLAELVAPPLALRPRRPRGR